MITCEFEDGGKGLLRHVSANALIIKDNKILLGKRGTYNGGKPLPEMGKWAMLGGFLGRDESIEEAMKREIMEESGWSVNNLVLFHIKDNPDRPKEDRQNIEFVYIAEAVEKTKDSDEETAELKWFSLNELPSEDEMGFDHNDDLILYKRYLNEKFHLPYLGKLQK